MARPELVTPDRRGFTPVELLIVIAVIGLTAALLVPSVLRIRRNERVTRCLSNLQQLWKAADTARAAQSPPRWPSTTGGAFWVRLTEGPNPLLPGGSEILICPLADHDAAEGHTSYRGPVTDANRYAAKDPLGADRPGNHGRAQGGAVVLVSGEVRLAREFESLWAAAGEKTAP